MKNLLLILFIISSINLFSQGTITEYEPLVLIKLKDKSLIISEKILFKTDSNLYFQLLGEETYYKLNTSKLEGEISCRYLKKTKPGDFILKFVKQSQSGLTLSIIGGTSSAILPFLIQSSAVLILPPVISMTGLIIWISSYKHLKQYGIINSAIEFKQ